MKSELITSIGAAIAGVLIAYFVCNLFLGEIGSISVKTVEGSVSTELANPDPEVFNYRALNPTVEIYIGDCINYDSNGVCLDSPDDTNLEGSNQNSDNNQSTTNNGTNQENP